MIYSSRCLSGKGTSPVITSFLFIFTPISDISLHVTDEMTMQKIKVPFNCKGILATISAARGRDIFVFCRLFLLGL